MRPTEQTHIYFIGGPTASGKTSAAIALAKSLNTEIISADSRQFYTGMAIGTAQPSSEELSEVKHHFINFRSPTQLLNAGEYENLALQKIQELSRRFDKLVVVGGSGLFLKAIYQGFDQFPEVPKSVRTELNAEFQDHGLAPLLKELEQRDPVIFARIDQHNHQRVIRALEVCRASQKAYSSFLNQAKAPRPFTYSLHKTEISRNNLYQRINDRVDLMYKTGLLEEVKALEPVWNCDALNTVGYKENIAYLEGQIPLNQATELLKKNTRNFAKRQETWFKKEGFVAMDPNFLKSIS